MTLMTDRGLPIVDGAPACPFVAFEDDRDSRATSPDHRHRCYAEIRPAPRALAHQEAYCLSSAFPICPTFQDWARREAAQAKAAAEVSGPVVIPGAERGPGATDRTIEQAPETVRRNPPREWSAPPPWFGANQEQDEDGEVQAIPQRGGGLSGSLADRMAGSEAEPAPENPTWRPTGSAVEPEAGHETMLRRHLSDDDDDADRPSAAARRGAPSRPRER
jgi:hypothetical protein